MEKIDFFGGLHGHFLELVLNVSVFQINFNIDRALFNSTGACHLKHEKYGDEYKPVVTAFHYSYNNVPFSESDRVVRITCQPNDMLIAVINSFTRAGNEFIDLENFEINTLDKLNTPKATEFRQNIIDNLGVSDLYSRAELRKYFQSMFDDPLNGLTYYNCFSTHPGPQFEFAFRNFFSVDLFYTACNQVGQFFNLDFVPPENLYRLHQDFLINNQGWHSENKCKKIIECIISGESHKITCNIVEEAWINSQIARIFRCYDLPALMSDSYATDCKELHTQLFEWKKEYLYQ